jgi:hypothetical protein
MSSFVPSQDLIAKAFVIAGLALVAPSTYYFRNYNRVLDYVQMFFVFALIYAPTSGDFSLSLSWGLISFIPNFLTNYCVTNDFICNYGYLHSAAIGWFGIALLMLIIIKIVSCKKNGVKYQPFYNFWKGIFRWITTPLVFYSTMQIISQAQNNNFMDRNFYASAGVCVFLFIWLFA